MEDIKNLSFFEHFKHGKRNNPEDQLTSYVFSTVEFLRQNNILTPFEKILEKLDIQNYHKNSSWNITFWPRYNICDSIVEPDVVYLSNKYIICIECKRNGEFYNSQLKAERKIEDNFPDREFKFLTISNHSSKPDIVSNNDCHWISWSFFHEQLTSIKNIKLNQKGSTFIVRSLINYLEGYDMTTFNGFNQKDLWSYTTTLDQIKRGIKTIGNFIESLDDNLSKNNSPIHRRYSQYSNEERSSRAVCPLSYKINHPENWIRSQFYFPYYKSDWEAHGVSHVLYLCFDFKDSPTLKIGVRLNISHVEGDTDNNRKNVIDKLEELDKIKEKDILIYGTNEYASVDPSKKYTNFQQEELKFLGAEYEMCNYYNRTANKLLEEAENELEYFAEEFGQFFGKDF